MANFSWPSISVSASSGPVQFTKNGGTTTVTQDTVTVGNSIPLPVINLNTAGNETGTSTVPFRIDPTGTTTQPVSIAAALPSGTNVIGHVINDAGSAVIGKVGIDQSTPGTTNLVALAANQSVNVAQMNGVTTTMGNGIAGTGVQRVAIASDNTAFSVNATLQTGANVIGALTANQSVNNAQINGVTPLMGNGVTGTGSQRVTIASDNTAFSVNAVQSGTWTVQPGNTANTTAWLTSQVTSTTATVTSVASSATTVSLLASNASRKNATFFNDSTQTLYLKLGATASTTSYTVQILAGGYYELPVGKIYSGAIDGIWASANGNARITELT